MPDENQDEETLENSSEDDEDRNDESEDGEADENEEKSEEGEDEESELEEELKQGFDDFQFNNISWPSTSESDAPVLEKIADEQPSPVFVGTIPRRPAGISGEENEEGAEFKYVPGSEQDGEARYITTPSGVNTQPERVDFSKIGRGSLNVSAPPRRVSAAESYAPKVESPMPERAFKPERIDTERAGRNDLDNPNERDDIKYEKYKSRLDS